jgi:uncharacterized repeat protein (TIGR03803 family)
LLHSFAGTPDGAQPLASLSVDEQGNLYGTTSGGGAFGAGSVFKIDTGGKETVLYSFTGTDGDGAAPHAGVVLDAQGNLYGTTNQGGAHNVGSVFKLDTSSNETVLHSFNGTDGDGEFPSGNLVLNLDGNLYGTTSRGGGGDNSGGTVFKVDMNGVEAVLYRFNYPAKAQGLARDAAGNLYGTTRTGGSGHGIICDSLYGCGTLFKITTSGALTVLHEFTFRSGNDGAVPNGELGLDAQGSVYGTTEWGGLTFRSRENGSGTVFKVDTQGTETLLYEFSDGERPLAGVVIDPAGNLYGTTSHAFPGAGSVYKLDTTGTETLLYTFRRYSTSGYSPSTGLAIDSLGNLYGTTTNGGTDKLGSVFDLLTSAPFTTTTLSSAPNPSVFGQDVTFTAAVSFGDSGTPPDGGTVSFMKAGTVLGTGTLSAGSASFTTSTLNVGTTEVKAIYAGAPRFDGSASGKVKQRVKAAE